MKSKEEIEKRIKRANTHAIIALRHIRKYKELADKCNIPLFGNYKRYRKYLNKAIYASDYYWVSQSYLNALYWVSEIEEPMLIEKDITND